MGRRNWMEIDTSGLVPMFCAQLTVHVGGGLRDSIIMAGNLPFIFAILWIA